MPSQEGTYDQLPKASRPLNVILSMCLYPYNDDIESLYQQPLKAGATLLAEP